MISHVTVSYTITRYITDSQPATVLQNCNYSYSLLWLRSTYTVYYVSAVGIQHTAYWPIHEWLLLCYVVTGVLTVYNSGRLFVCLHVLHFCNSFSFQLVLRLST